MKKAQGLSLNMMAVAVIILIVVIVTIAIFTGFIGDTIPILSERVECEKQAGAPKCLSLDECRKKGGTEIYGLGCEKNSEKPYCCVVE